MAKRTWRHVATRTSQVLSSLFSSQSFAFAKLKMMNPEYDFADEHDATNEKQAEDDQSTGDHEDSDEEGVQGPPPPTEFKRLLEE